MGDSTEQIGLYAEDIILYMWDTQNTLTKAMSIIDTFGQYSGLKINWQKSFLMPLHQELEMEEKIEAPLRIVDSFKYLGIYITRQPWEALAANVNPLMEYIKSKLKNWSNLPHSVVGRINLIKMILLPKCLYIFSHSPVVVPKKIF